MGWVRYFFKRCLYYLTLPFRFIFKLPTHVVSAPRKLFGLSLPMRVAVILAVFIPLLCLVAILGYLADPINADLEIWKDWGWILLLLLLNIAVPVCAYYGVDAWLKPEVSDHPSIDKAFNMGLSLIEENNIDIGEVPIILVLGAATRAELHNVFTGAGFKYIEPSGTPKGDFPLVWYIRQEGPTPVVFLATVGIGCSGHLNQLAAGNKGGGPDRSELGPRGTVLSPDMAAGPRGTVVIPAADSGDAETEAAENPGHFKGTIVNFQGSVASVMQVASAKPSPGFVELSPTNEKNERDKLTHVLGRLGRIRQPLCWFNGIVMLTPWQALNSKIAVDNLSEAIRKDIITTQLVAKIRVPLVALVSGLERDRGFIELVHQVGFDTARASRFGKGLPNEVLCDQDIMLSLADQSCAAFESCVYDLYRREKSLTANAANSRMYLLLGRVRSKIRKNVRRLLSQGLAYKKGDQLVPVPVAGCYFAATGSTNDQRAFVGSVFEKLIKLEFELEWTPSMVKQDKTLQKIAQILTVLSGLVFAALVATLGWLAFQG